MEIKRKVEMFAVARRRYIICPPKSGELIRCAECGRAALTAEQAAHLFGMSQRRIFRFIETGAVHFIETDAGATFICPSSLAVVLPFGGDGQTDAV